jgi:hypothetical protein
MKNLNSLIIIFVVLLFTNYNGLAQLGIGTINPDSSSMLDVQSTSKGFLAPRMTTIEKNAISSPATGLMVYDNDLGKFNYFDGSSWVTVESSDSSRDNYVLVKSLADFPTPVSGVITLQYGVLYEINGVINLGSNSINLNNTVLVGGNPVSDQLIYSGSNATFSGSEGGLVQFLNLQGSAGATKLFQLNDASLTKNMIIRDCFVSNFGSIGTIGGFGFTFIRTMSYFNNTDGLTFSGASQLYLYDMIWNSTNSGTATTYTGNFGVISMTGGNIMVDSGETGIDVTANPTIAAAAIIRGATFTGAGTRTSGMFSKEWEIESAGLNTEKDDKATGSIYINTPNTTVISAKNVPTKVSGTTTAANLFRADTGSQSNRLRYTGTKTRFFEVIVTFSLFGGNQDVYAFFIYKNGVRVPSIYVENKVASNGDIGAATIMGTVELAPNDYVELWVENLSASANCTINAMNFIIK